MPGRQPRTQLEKGLVVPVGLLVEDRTPRGICQGPEDVPHPPHNRQALTCLSSSFGDSLDGRAAACADSGAQSLEQPPTLVGPAVAEPVVEPARSALPQLDGLGDDPVATPVLR